MSTNHTTNYGLCQWLATDQVLRTDFNQDNAKIDTALKSLSDQVGQKASQSALNTVISTVNQKAEQEDMDNLENSVQQISADLTKLTFGSYEGDGAAVRVISLGFTPKAVLVMQDWGAMYDTSETKEAITGGLALPNAPVARGSAVAVEIVSNGFQVRYRTDHASFYVYTNRDAFPYRYIAFS